jgi:hypothetical protein
MLWIALLALFAVGWRLGLPRASRRWWLNCLLTAIWGAAVLELFAWTRLGWSDPLSTLFYVSLGALGGALGGLGASVGRSPPPS